MGSSSKKKKEKKKDFQKPKLKVGKAKPKAANYTDTKFQARSIVLAHQSLSETAPDAVSLFNHNLSLATTSRSDRQRRDALAHLAGQLSTNPPNNPPGTPALLAKLLPLVSDGAAPVRAQLLGVLKTLPAPEVRPLAERIGLYARAGMTHLSAEVRDDALNIVEWLLDVAGREAVGCPGGWAKTLNTFAAMMGWGTLAGASAASAVATRGAAAGAKQKGWTSAPKTTFGAQRGGQSYERQLRVLARFLDAGFSPERILPYEPRAYWDGLYRISRAPDPFGYLNLFGSPRDGDGEMYADREDRQHVFVQRWKGAVEQAVEEAKKEGGAVGRAAATLDQVLKDGLADLEAA